MTEPLVSIITPTFNRADYLAEAIQSVLAQTYQNFEMLIVDNGSTDRTSEVVASFNDPRLRYYYQENSGSPVSPRNRGFTLARGEIICFLDSDDLWLSHKLERQTQQLTSNSSLKLVYADCYLVNSMGDLRGRYSDFQKPYQGRILPNLLRSNFIPAVTVAFRKNMLDEFGLLNEAYLIPHDLDWYLKISNKYEVGYIDEPLAKLRIHNVGLSRNRIRNRIEVMQIVEPWCEDRGGHLPLPVKRKIWAYHCFKTGVEMMGVPENRQEGKKMLRKAIRHNPFNPIYWFGIVLGVIPLNLTRQLMVLAKKHWSIECTYL